jgi:hypothetical protein
MRKFQFVTALIFQGLLTGCGSVLPFSGSTASSVGIQTQSPVKPTISDPVSAPVTSPKAAVEHDSAPASTAATLCQRELTALAGIDKRLYTEKKTAFDGLLASASTYITVRSDVDARTRESMDALYKYRTQKICDDINRSVQEALIKQGENFR